MLEMLPSERFLSRLGQEPRIRIFIETTGGFWTDLGIRVADTFRYAELPFRLNSLNGACDLAIEPWESRVSYFTGEINPDLQLLNVVVGFGSYPFTQFYTEKYKNIAVTAPYPKKHDIACINALSKYNEVWLPTWNTLQKCGPELSGRCRTHVVNLVSDGMDLFQKESIGLSVLERVHDLLEE